MASRFETVAQAVDDLIRAGKGIEARKALRGLGNSKVPRKMAVELAVLARRANVPLLGVRALAPIVRPLQRSAGPASEKERAEYAACLTRIGAPEEALELLDGIDERAVPQVCLYQSFARFNRWEYAAAIPLLRRFVKTVSLDEYQRLIGNVNLAAALVFEREHAEASRTLGGLIEATKRKGHALLYANALELSVQNSLFQGDLGAAGEWLRKAEAAALAMGGVEALYVRQWKAVLAILRSRADVASLAMLSEVRAEAASKHDWEMVRTCDRYRAIATKDDALWRHVYFGTPFESFRRRLVVEYGGSVDIPERYTRALGIGEGPLVDAMTGGISGRPDGLGQGSTGHRLFAKLASDFYRPFRLASLHYALHPGEHFNPASSPFRARQALRRLRGLLAARALPLQIAERDGWYRLDARAACGVVVPRVFTSPDSRSGHIASLRSVWPSGPFSAAEAGKRLGVSPRTALRILESARERGVLARSGKGTATRYAFAA